MKSIIFQKILTKSMDFGALLTPSSPLPSGFSCWKSGFGANPRTFDHFWVTIKQFEPNRHDRNVLLWVLIGFRRPRATRNRMPSFPPGSRHRVHYSAHASGRQRVNIIQEMGYDRFVMLLPAFGAGIQIAFPILPWGAPGLVRVWWTM